MPRTPRPIRYIPVHELGSQAHVMIDGAARPGTAANFSHWPHSSTPPTLQRDLSAQIVLAAVQDGHLDQTGVEVATIDHYDEDGVIALALAVVPGLAEAHSDLLVEAARVGDFGIVTDRRAALVAFSLASLAAPARTPLASVRALEAARQSHLEVCGLAATHALTIISDLATDPVAFESLWREEAAAYDEASRGMGEWVRIEELPEHDLAIVWVHAEAPRLGRSGWGTHVVHPAAVNTATERLRIAVVCGSRMELHYRYESWVRMQSYRPRPRVDLSGLASVLTALEPEGTTWSFDGAGATRPALKTVGGAPSRLSPDVFVTKTTEHLARLDSGPPAWDPDR